MRYNVSVLLLIISLNSFAQLLEETLTKKSISSTDIAMVTANNGYVGEVDVISPKLVSTFKASKKEIVAGDFVDFTDLAAGNPGEWEWSFEGANPRTSSVKNPMHITYTNAGCYGVKLTVKKGNASETKTMNNFISVYPILKANFTPNSNKDILMGQSINFSGLATGGASTYEWTFEGGTPSSSTLKDPWIMYSTPGRYKVSLKVTANIQSDTKVVEGLITVRDLKAQF